MRIAMFCSGRLPTPPVKEKLIYAPLWITSVLADEMANRGHKVTLFGAKGTKSKAKIATLNLPPLERHPFLKNHTNVRDNRIINFYEQLFISEIYRRAAKGKFDVIHIHPVDSAIAFAAGSPVPTVFTLHDPISLWRKFIYSSYKKFKNIYYVAISDAQREPLKNINYAGTVYNGIDINKYPFNGKPKEYLFAAGRIVPQKGFDVAIKVAKETNLPLKIAGENLDEHYWNKEIKPHLGEKIEYIGTLSPAQMPEFYKNAKAFLFPIKWEEPFGLVMTEAMACGTPVIAFNRGSVSEIVKNGKNGFVVNNDEEMIDAVKKIGAIDRKKCRQSVEDNFSLKKMADGYEKIYQKILKRKL